MGALSWSDAAQIVNLIKFLPDEVPYQSLKECLTKLHTLNLFQRYQALISLTLVADEKLSTLMD